MNNKATIRKVFKMPIRDNIIADFHTFNNLSDSNKEHFALGFGQYREMEVPLVRIHSECITGDVFGSQKCDCGIQLQDSIDRFSKDGGVLLYLRQEGRGIGLINKIDSYVLQEQGLDTFTANHELGFDHDLRDYTIAAEILKALSITNIKLLSNNSDKEKQLNSFGINVVKRFNTIISVTRHNRIYMEAKANISKHSINF